MTGGRRPAAGLRLIFLFGSIYCGIEEECEWLYVPCFAHGAGPAVVVMQQPDTLH